MKIQTPQNLHCLQLQLWQLHGPSYIRVCVGFTSYFVAVINLLCILKHIFKYAYTFKYLYKITVHSSQL